VSLSQGPVDCYCDKGWIAWATIWPGSIRLALQLGQAFIEVADVSAHSRVISGEGSNEYAIQLFTFRQFFGVVFAHSLFMTFLQPFVNAMGD